eukprot:3314369-Prymnesium_polylepis.1
MSLEQTAGAAAAAGLPRISAINAARFVPPDLNHYKGATHFQLRNAFDAKPVLWFFQMTCSRWDGNGVSYARAKTTEGASYKKRRRKDASEELSIPLGAASARQSGTNAWRQTLSSLHTWRCFASRW